MTEEELNILLKIKTRSVEEQRDFLLEQNMLLTGKIATLEKENAELKDYRLKTLKEQQTGIQKYALNLEHKLNWYDDQLTKAKEIIREFVDWANWQGNSKCPSFKSIQDKAEQFLNEVEK